MREIKFRAWDVKYKMMFPVAQITADSSGDFNNIPHRIPMQYTGLKDKNGKEIYEGDILICPDLIDRYGQVNYRQEVCSFELLIKEQTSKTSIKFYNYTLDDVTKFEIIGNIYENGELLK